MSCGGGGYSVVSNRVRMERERQAAVARSAASSTRLRQVENAVRARQARSKPAAAQLPKLLARPSDSASADEHNRWANTVDSVLRTAVDELARAESADRAAALAEHLQRVASSGAMAARFVAPERAGTQARHEAAAGTSGGIGSAGDAASPEQLAAALADLVSALPPGATAAERAAAERLATEVAQAPAGGRATLMTELKVRVQEAGRAAAAREAQAARAEKLLRTLDGLDGAEVADLRAILERAIAGQADLLVVDESRVATVRAKAIAEEDTRYARTELAHALADLGYEVGDLVDASASSEPVSYVFLPDAPGHAVELRFEHGRYDYQLVRTTPTADPVRDAALEHALCKDIGQATAVAYGRGVQWTLDHHRPPGEAAAPYAAAAQQHRWYRGTRLQERQRER